MKTRRGQAGDSGGGRRSIPGLAALLAMGLILSAGCGGEPGKLKQHIVSGQDQTVLPETLTRPLAVVIEERKPGLLGGKGADHGVPGKIVEFELVEGPEAGTLEGLGQAEELAPDRVKVTTAVDGLAKVRVRVGQYAGDLHVKATSAVGSETFRVAAGLVLEGDKTDGHPQEGSTGSKLDEPMGVRLVDAQGRPRVGVPVRFILQEGKGAKLTSTAAVTDAEGRAQTYLKLGKETGWNRFEIVPKGQGIDYEPVNVKAFAVGYWSMLLKVIGGLAVFIWGMQTMSLGLQRVAGNRMRSVVQTVVRNRFTGMAAGASITGLIQSSSAFTVMVVGLVNAGLMNLEQAIATVLGANIGTTVTAQIIAFKISSWAAVAVAAGVVLHLVMRRRSMRFWGQVLIGFGLLFIGLSTMSGTLKVLADSPNVYSLFNDLSCATASGGIALHKALFAVLLGTTVTVLVQSSSASIGLLVSLASAGLLDFQTSVAILLGDNIGTTITMELAAIGANRTAKQAAHAHTTFNVVGTLLMLTLFFITWNGKPVFLVLINAITPGDAWAGQNLERHIANTHTAFNVSNALLHLPLIGLLAAFCRWTHPRHPDSEDDRLEYLEHHLLEQPPLALERVRSELVYMLQLARKSHTVGFAGLLGGRLDENEIERIKRREGKIDERQFAIAEYLQRLTQRPLNEEESAAVPLLLHAAHDVERIGDHAENVVKLVTRLHEERTKLQDDATDELKHMHDKVLEMLELVAEGISSPQPGTVARAREIETELDRLDRELGQSNARRVEQGQCSPQAGLLISDMINVMERIGDHLCNVVERVIEFNDRTSDEPGGDGSESPSEPPQSPTPKTVSRSPQPEGVTGS